MNCQNVISQMGFSCRDLGGETLRVWSPFTHIRGGDRIGFYLEKTVSGYRVTDNCETLMHASVLGATWTPNRLMAARKASGFGAELSEGGEISAFVSDGDIGRGMARVLNAALAVSHLSTQWEPRLRAQSFSKDVEELLEDYLGDRVLKKVTVTGASGHQLELPLAVKDGESLIYVQPISATDESTVDWKGVYEGWGRMTDLKNALIQNSGRLIVMEDAANDSEMKRAVTLLSDSSPVLSYTKLATWAERMRA